MFRYSDDPIADHEAYEAELARLEKLVPKCCKCKQPVPEDFYYLIDEEVFCAECLDKHFKKRVEIE